MKLRSSIIASGIYNSIKKDNSPANALSIAHYIVKNKLKKHLPEIMRNLDKKISENIITTISTYPLSEKELAECKSLFTKHVPATKDYVIINKIKPIIGGLILETNSHRLDLSLDESIDRLKEQLWQNNK